MEPNFEVGDLISPMRPGEYQGVYLVESIGPTSDQLNCRSLTRGPLGEIHVYFPKEVLWAWKPSYSRFDGAKLRAAFEAAPTASISTARVGAVSVVDKRGHPYFMPAVFDGKRLVLQSTCELHPKYQALRPPRSKKAGCSCAAIYERRNAIDSGR